ncbi:heavy metal sensor kinase [Maridesulfovibrio ferrireducens]|uniref:histidine kinase n=1 Tax=Maridesulfovibrio ferrireducens TaxID=246191 RepID=A0A1G9JIW8_9BACT|nr:ATP-binding protein [Maridesulfovibrio ferrireducens]SDL37054.1 heavy metal sensor kinase [Maridesulfovibrio ferrireducens]
MNLINTIRFKFTLWYLSILSVLLILLGSGIYFTLSGTLHRNFDDSLKVRGKQLADFKDLIPIIASGTFEEEAGEFVSIYFYTNGELTHISHKGHEVPISKPLVNQALSGESIFSTTSYINNEKVRVFATHYAPVNPVIHLNRFVKKMNGLEPRGGRFPEKSIFHNNQAVEIKSAALVIARPTKDMNLAIDQLLRILLTAIPLTIAISGFGGVFLTRKAFNPVKEITKTAQEIGEHDLSQRIKIKTKDELGELSTVLNKMIGRIERAFQRQTEFTADASHELRAPLAVIQAEATLTLEKERDAETYRKALEIIAQESNEMSLVINQLLTLARADAGKEHLEFKSIDMAEFISAVCDDIAILCREKEVILKLCSLGKVFVYGEKSSLRRLLVNILSNAIRYTPKGGVISVGLKSVNNSAVITIRDTGIGIPQEELAHIFKRFYRVDKARSRKTRGSGLGLSICKQIVDTHKGQIEVESCIGIGSVFYVKIPIA